MDLGLRLYVTVIFEAPDGGKVNREMYHIPRVGETCIFSGIRLLVVGVDWKLDESEMMFNQRVFVRLGLET